MAFCHNDPGMEPLVVSCERTVRAGGAGKHATMTEPVTGDQFLN